MAYLNIPDKKAYAKEQLAIRHFEARIKRARLEESLAEIVSDESPREVNVVTSNTSNTAGVSSKECSHISGPTSNTICGAGDYCFTSNSFVCCLHRLQA
jgi:hypothetical protein